MRVRGLRARHRPDEAGPGANVRVVVRNGRGRLIDTAPQDRGHSLTVRVRHDRLSDRRRLRGNLDNLIVCPLPKENGRDETGRRDNLVVVEEIVIRHRRRVPLGRVLNHRISDEEKILSGDHPVRAGNVELVARNGDHPRRNVRLVNIERARQRLNIHSRRKLRRSEQSQIVRVSKRRHMRGVILSGRELHRFDEAAHLAERVLSLRRGIRTPTDVRNVDMVETAVLLILRKEVDGRQELIPIIGRDRRFHNAGGEICQTALLKKCAAEHIVIDGDLIELLPIHRMVTRLNLRKLPLKQHALHVLTIRVPCVGLEQANLQLLNRIAVFKHPALELSERVAPRHIPRIGRTNTVDKRLNELIVVYGKLVKRCDRFGDSCLSRFGDSSLIVIRQLRTNTIHDDSVIGVSQFAENNGHYRAFRVKLNISSKSLIAGDSSSSAPLVGSLVPTSIRRSKFLDLRLLITSRCRSSSASCAATLAAAESLALKTLE